MLTIIQAIFTILVWKGKLRSLAERIYYSLATLAGYRLHPALGELGLDCGPVLICRCDLDMLSEFLTVVGCERVNQICYWAPYSAAELLGMAEQIGTVESRKLAHLVVLDADPQADISAVRQVHMVIKAGQRV